ncbi:MAG: PorP/SprF family type IX secretion system membrane protein [Bacteroidales bacterium]|nr:PorP/SprF family type IX secretion system membrane protein [Bacteroidales bacterium]
MSLVIKRISILALVLNIFIVSNAQDIHFSQFLFSPLNLNPALTGSFEGDLRAATNHKSQWQSFANAYSSFSASIDGNLKSPIVKPSFFGLGLLLNTDRAGDGNLTTNQVKLSAAWHLPILKDSSLFFSLAGNVAYTSHGLNLSRLRFGNQYFGGQYNPEIPHNEVLQAGTIKYFDYSAGVGLGYSGQENITYQIGFSVQHINEPEKSFQDNNEITLPRKYTYHASAEWNIKDDLCIDPFILFMHQGTYLQANFGSFIRINYNPLGLKYVFAGISMRARDSGIATFGANYQDIRIAISYDVNLSKLTAISRGRGSIELSLMYIFRKPRSFEAPFYRKCPEFI